MPLAVMLRSVITNLDSRRVLKVYIVDSGIDPGTRSRISASLPERVTLQWLVPERTGFVDLPLWGRMTIATYDKLTIGRWLPKSEERALWLDCDLLALCDLSRLLGNPPRTIRCSRNSGHSRSDGRRALRSCLPPRIGYRRRRGIFQRRNHADRRSPLAKRGYRSPRADVSEGVSTSGIFLGSGGAERESRRQMDQARPEVELESEIRPDHIQ